MNEIWANRLAAETKTWAEMPISRRRAVKDILISRVVNNIITVEHFEKITGEKFPAELMQ